MLAPSGLLGVPPTRRTPPRSISPTSLASQEHTPGCAVAGKARVDSQSSCSQVRARIWCDGYARSLPKSKREFDVGVDDWRLVRASSVSDVRRRARVQAKP